MISSAYNSSTLEQTAVSPVRSSTPIVAGGAYAIDDERRRALSRRGDRVRDEGASDATGLSLSADDIAKGLEALKREQSATEHERAYRAAGGRARATSSSQPSSSAAATHATQSADASGGALGTLSSPPMTAPSTALPTAATATGTATGTSAATPLAETAAREIPQSSREAKAAGTAGALSAFSEAEKAELQELKSRDREVRTHEQAHIGASGGLSRGGASFEHERGPDGRMYAVAGEVQIDSSEAASPEATIDKAQRIRAAALAPAEPSGQDRQVAAQAAQMEATARQELAGAKGERGRSSGVGAATRASEAGQTGETGQLSGAGQTGETGRMTEAGQTGAAGELKRSDMTAATGLRASHEQRQHAVRLAAYTSSADSASEAGRDGAAGRDGEAGIAGRRPLSRHEQLLERATRAYERAEGGRGVALWGSGLSYAV